MKHIRDQLIDHRGAEIKPGCRVAYNLSGEIGCGIVEEATPAIREDNGWGYKKRALIKIRAEGKISKVRCPRNVMVIESTLT